LVKYKEKKDACEYQIKIAEGEITNQEQEVKLAEEKRKKFQENARDINAWSRHSKVDMSFVFEWWWLSFTEEYQKHHVTKWEQEAKKMKDEKGEFESKKAQAVANKTKNKEKIRDLEVELFAKEKKKRN